MALKTSQLTSIWGRLYDGTKAFGSFGWWPPELTKVGQKGGVALVTTDEDVQPVDILVNLAGNQTWTQVIPD